MERLYVIRAEKFMPHRIINTFTCNSYRQALEFRKILTSNRDDTLYNTCVITTSSAHKTWPNDHIGHYMMPCYIKSNG